MYSALSIEAKPRMLESVMSYVTVCTWSDELPSITSMLFAIVTSVSVASSVSTGVSSEIRLFAYLMNAIGLSSTAVSVPATTWRFTVFVPYSTSETIPT